MQNKINRRKFIDASGKLAFGLGAGLAGLPLTSCTQTNHKSNVSSIASDPAGLKNFGIQLYTLKDEMEKDSERVFNSLSKYGFDQIESYEGKDGMFWGMSNKDFKTKMQDLGLDVVASHVNIFEDFEKKVIDAAQIDMKYLVCPWVGPQKSMDDWKKITDTFNECGQICKKHGIGFAYHNHAYTFKAFSGMIPHDYIMDNTDPETVKHEMDIYWVVTGGADPIDYLKKYSGRFTLCHIKDRSKNVAIENHDASCDLGTGTIDFPKILNVAQANGMEFFFMEQEHNYSESSLNSAKLGAEYLSQLTFS